MDLHGFGYTFPFPIMCDAAVATWQPIAIDYDDIKVVIYHPFMSGPNGRITNDFDLANSPSFKIQRIHPTVAGLQVPGFRTTPQCFKAGLSKPPKQTETNSLQIEFHTADEHAASSAADDLLSRFLRQARRQTGQFWIGRPAIYFEGYLRTQYRVENGKMPHEFWSNSRIYSGNTRMLTIDYNMWRAIWSRVDESEHSDSIDSMLLAEHHKAGGELFEAMYQAAIAVEKAKYELWDTLFQHKKCSKGKYKSALNDTQKPERYFGCNLPNDCGISFDKSELSAVRNIWVVRGLISHGNEEKITKVLGRTIDLDQVNSWTDLLWSAVDRIKQFSGQKTAIHESSTPK
jgi:hypothetical protein